MEKKQEKISLHDKDLYLRKNGAWSIVMMPDNIIIDNYHNKATHIHYTPEKHNIQTEIQINNVNIIYNIVLKHILTNKRLKINELLEELKK